MIQVQYSLVHYPQNPFLIYLAAQQNPITLALLISAIAIAAIVTMTENTEAIAVTAIQPVIILIIQLISPQPTEKDQLTRFILGAIIITPLIILTWTLRKYLLNKADET